MNVIDEDGPRHGYIARGITSLEDILPHDPTIKKLCQFVKDKLKDSHKDVEGTVVHALAKLMTDLKYTDIVAKCFPKLLLHLINRVIPLEIPEVPLGEDAKRKHLINCLVLGKLIRIHPDALQYSLQYFHINPSPFNHIDEDRHQLKTKRRRFNSEDSTSGDLELLSECCYAFLDIAPNIFKHKWKWSTFIENCMTHPNPKVKWNTCKCIEILYGMTETRSRQLESTVMGDANARSCTLQYECSKDLVWDKTIGHDVDSSNDRLEAMDTSEHVVNVGGILLPVYDLKKKHDSLLVPVKSTQDNLRSLALSVATGKATCLVGPVGCGKTTLIEHLAVVTGRTESCLRKVQLGDQTDSRTLLGTYRCTDIPGEFIWQPGVLTQAVQQGQWLLLEDIDCAAIDVASVLSSLLERNVLSVPGYRDAIPVAPGFQLFVTQRTVSSSTGQKQSSSASALLQKHWTQINIEPLSRQELITIVEHLYSKLKTISSRIVDVFMLFSAGSHQTSLHNIENEVQHAPLVRTLMVETSEILATGSGRLTSTRDLMKWCSRAVINFDVTSQDSALKVLQDAIDIFACSIPEKSSRVPLAKAIGAYLGIVETKAEYYCDSHKPTVSLSPSTIQIGRAGVQRKEIPLSSINLQEKKVIFSFTRSSTCLLERIACCVNANEPVLLVGETGTGKTSTVQYLAKESGNKLVVINMNQQSDSADLLGGYKPVDLKFIISPIRNEFETLFRGYYDVVKNAKFLEYIAVSFESNDWKTLLALMKQSQAAAMRRLSNTNVQEIMKSGKRKSTDPSTESKKNELMKRWWNLGNKLDKLELQLKSETSLAFSFIEGSLVRALRKGYWVLLDEINLASAETLECLSGLLEGRDSSISLLERGDNKAIDRHKDFILFACMNPATDVGKRDLPAGLRNRFTEFFVDELTEKRDLLLLVGDYLKDLSIPPTILEAIYKFYIGIKKEAKINLTDGTGQCPHFSLRTLCRALSSVGSAKCGTVTRSLYEAMCLSFLTQLDSVSHPKVQNMIANAVLGKKNLKSILNQPIPEPKPKKGEHFINFEGYWICQGKNKPVIPDNYILTPSVRKNLRDLVRIISIGKLPILLQGDTSVGKTSLIMYIAKVSGNHCVRINNHQHTDLQEYIGSYATDSGGKLVFREGVLVEAMRKGHWIILDELNLAPSDVLEALNRVLDDNRELFIPETQQVVKADPNFMLFATQNPPGLYGGRKLLSRAFRNRFVELHFDEIPRPELETILHERCHMPPSYCKKIIAVMAELQARRKGSAAVQGKEGFITLRDLFRWGQRYKAATDDNSAKGKYYDWDQHIADEGYLVLAGRVRQMEERVIIQEVLQKHVKRIVDPENLFSLSEKTSIVTRYILEKILNADLEEFNHVVWTLNMRRLAVLIAKSFTFNEPVLLVGETGCGKTTVCQVLAALRKCKLFSVNCHMHTEGADFLGGLRPVRHYNDDGKLFEWVDGPLIEAMKSGHLFLADEISLADDSVLERLNSLLETERQLLVAEKGIDMEDNSTCIVMAHENFHFIGTMNPGGDYGKKELSPALRNRFTEIWCDHITSKNDLIQVIEKSVCNGIKLKDGVENVSGIGECIIEFVDWFKATKIGERFPCSIRDLLSWVHFINTAVNRCSIDVNEAYVHGASLIFLDCFGTGMSGAESVQVLNDTRKAAIEFLLKQIQSEKGSEKIDNLKMMLLDKNPKIAANKLDDKFGIDPFYITYGNCDVDVGLSKPKFQSVDFTFTAPTTGVNTMRLLRGLQLNKPILLEGSPGVGKTSLVTALAKVSGHKVLRINLSDQTDISDLFGADLPTPEGTFAWQEGAFLTALQNGDWILLDELNLAPQPVLEGLNACLDHRGEVFIPELGKTFKVKTETRIFACQNPLRQGGSRRGLPKSFLNRFTQVFVDTLSDEDLNFITSSQYPSIPNYILNKMIDMNSKIVKETSEMLWGHRGSPWELNLRDIQRWCDGLMNDFSSDQVDGELNKELNPGRLARLLYVDRMRTLIDKEKVKTIYTNIFCPEHPLSSEHPAFYITESHVHVGDVKIERNTSCLIKNNEDGMLLLRNQLPVLKSVMQCVNMNWLAILVGPASSGKNSCVQTLAQVIGKELNILPVVSAMDTSDLLGGFEQTDYNRHLEDVSTRVEKLVYDLVQNLFLRKDFVTAIALLEKLETFKFLGCEDSNTGHTMKEEVKLCVEKERCLQIVLSELANLDESKKEVVAELAKKLTHIRDMVVKEGSINAGGKFEWVDSLLVKCLLNGSWLLVDNVNLCSSAVLDRFNGLLEPNGVLSIPERGGAMDIIKPHPDFRMFFTMDPKNGEISRAMRNRGVEIYLLGADEHQQDISSIELIPDLDMSAMLSNTGLPPGYHKLFKIAHEIMCSFVSKYVRPSQIHLLKTAFLANQQILRGEQAASSIIKSFSDVYIKPRVSADFMSMQKSVAEFKNEMLAALEEFVKREFKLNSHCIETSNYLVNNTYSAVKLYRQSSFEVVKRDATLLDVATLKCNYENLQKIALLLYRFYHCSRQKDFDLRFEYINHLLSSINVSEKVYSWISKLNENVYQKIKLEIDDLNQDGNYLWDRQFLPELRNDNLIIDKCSNRISICFYYMATVSAHDLKYKNNSKTITALEYSLKVDSGQISDFTDLPVLKYCSQLIDAVDKTVLNVLSNTAVILFNEQWCNLVLLFNWRNRFYRVCNESLFVKVKKGAKITTSLREDVVVSMSIHYKWLLKYLLKKLLKIGHSGVLSLFEITEKIDRSIVTQNSPLRIIGKHLQKTMGQPTPYPDENVYKICEHRNHFLQKCLILSHDKYKLTILDLDNILLGKLRDAKKLFNSINNAFGFPDEVFYKQLLNESVATQNDTDIKEELDDKFKKSQIDEISFEIHLWPVREYLILKIVNLFKLRIFEQILKCNKDVPSLKCNEEDVLNLKLDDSSTTIHDVTTLLSYISHSVPALPLKLHSFLTDESLLLKDEIGSNYQQVSENLSEIWDIITAYQTMSPSANPNSWLKWSSEDLASEDTSVFVEKEVKADTLSLNLPHLTYNAIKLVYQRQQADQKDVPESQMSISTLSGWLGRSHQLATLHKILWRNMITANERDLRYHILDAKTIVINFERMSFSLQKALMRKENEKDINNYSELSACVANCVAIINKIYKEKIDCNSDISGFKGMKNHMIQCLNESLTNVQTLRNKLNNSDKNDGNFSQNMSLTLLTGKTWMLYASSSVLLFSDIGTMDPVRKNALKLEYINEDVKTVKDLLDLYLIQNVIDGTVSVTNEQSERIVSWNDSSDFIAESLPGDNSEKTNLNKDNLYGKLNNSHPHCVHLLKLKESSSDMVNVLSKGYTYRPSEPAFINLSKEYQHFICSLASPKVIQKHYNNLSKISNELFEIIVENNYDSGKISKLNTANDIVRECTTWQSSLSSFYIKIEKNYSLAYPDLTKSFLNSVTQLSYGAGILKNAIIKMSLMIKHGREKCGSVNEWVEDLIRFPLVTNRIEKIVFKDDLVLTKTFADFLKTFNTTDNNFDKTECYRLLKVRLRDIYNTCVTRRCLENSNWESFCSILNEIVATWQKQQREIDQKKLEEDLLYVNKTKCDDKTEEEQFEDDVKEMFPSFSDMDFADFKINALDQNKALLEKNKNAGTNNACNTLITSKDISEVSLLHSQLVHSCTSSEWMHPSSNTTNVSSDHLTPFLEKYNTFADILDQIHRGLDESLDAKVLPSLLVLVAHTRGTVDGEDYLDLNSRKLGAYDSNPDFYHDPWVAETKKCLPTLQLVAKTTLGYLKEWPDFPTLNDIMTVVNRILSFPLTSPVARFLTGMELLRDKMEEWNKSAHKGNTMIDISVVVAQQIVSWRKLELNSWKNSLNHSYIKCQMAADKWWFHMYTLVDCYISEKSMKDNNSVPNLGSESNPVSVMTSQQFILAMQQFVETSSIGEFHKRLDMLYTFHCHVVHAPSSNRKDEVICILWNLHKFYGQFTHQISQAIKDKRTPIEKKLKDFVKICTWERDLSYWAVKELVEKSHRIIRKHIKEFEEVLKTRASTFLTADKTADQGSEPVGIWDRPKRGAGTTHHYYMVDPQQYITSLRSAKKYFSEDSNIVTEDQKARGTVVLLPQMPSLLTKAQKICKEMFLTSAYPVLVQSLDGLVTTIIDSSKCLRELEISPDLPKPKQKSQAKHFLQQKKKGLADLFKALAKIGISYRAGLVEFTVRNGAILNFLVPPVNLKVSFEYLKNKRNDNVLLSVWEGCDLYYQRSVARLGALIQALLSPAPDLGLQNVERCKGYSVHLMLMVQDQKVRLAKSTRYLCILRNQVSQITALCESEDSLPNQNQMYGRLELLKDLYSNILQTMEQFQIVLKACPTPSRNDNEIENHAEDIAFDTAFSKSPLVKCYKNDAAWLDANDRVTNIVAICNKQINILTKLSPTLPMIYVYKKTSKLTNGDVLTQSHVDDIIEAVRNIHEVQSKINELISLHNETVEQYQNPIVNSLEKLDKYIADNIGVISVQKHMNFDTMVDLECFSLKVEGLVSFILYTMQEIYKRYMNIEKNDKSNEDKSNDDDKIDSVDDDQDEQIIQEHLRKELVENMKMDISSLNLPQLINRIDGVISELVSYVGNCENASAIIKKQLLRCVPLLEQMTLLSQFFVTQQVATHRVSCKMLSVLLNIFTELTTKGFCIPAEFGEEAGEGEGKGKMSGGMGLADGEGEKDVSERIENQDQLDDAQIPGQEKKEDKRDCKEEEKGIDMTDDFDSHLQDVEPQDGSDKDSDDEDVDKQMGETDTGVDKLDQQIWGSDDEEDDEESNQKDKKQEKEEKGDGKSLGDQQMGAKEDGQQEEDNIGEEKNRKDKKKDVNEMEEPEYDDDQVDPYHGNQKPLPEPEAMDLPDDLNIEESGDQEDEKEEDGKNPFEIDVMDEKKQPPPPEQEKEQKSQEDNGKKDSKAEGEDMDGDSTDNEEDGNDMEVDGAQKDKDEGEDDNEGEGEESDADKPDNDNPETEDLPDDIKDQDETRQQIPDENMEQNQKDEDDDVSLEDKEKKAENDDAKPSKDKPSSEDNLESSSMEKGSKDMTQTNPQIDKDEESAPYEQSQEQDGEEKEGVGQSELSDNQKGHRGDKEDRPKGSAAERRQKEDKKKDRRNKPGHTEQDRALGETKEPAKKRMKMLNMQDMNMQEDTNEQEEDGVGENNDPEQEADMYQHIKQAKERDVQVIDAATKEQAENQPVPNNPEEDGEELDPEQDVAMDDEDQDIQIDEALDKLESEKLGEDKKQENKKRQKNGAEETKGGEEPTGETAMEVDGEIVATHGVERGADTSYHTQTDIVRVPFSSVESSGITAIDVRQSLQGMGAIGQGGDEQRAAWHQLWGQTASQARLLTERLRLVLEPTGLSRLAGDYRTGRRINMRRVIPYIASHFRKDRIWLRRTRPARREYHIAVAIDDSSSMCDNSSKELAFESLALVSQALNLLEAGELAVLSFGEDPQILHSFGDQFTESSGCKLLQNLTFEQTKTKIAKLVDFASAMFEEQCKANNVPNAKLLLIVSDGRGIFSEGEAKVIQAVRRARQQGVFMVYLIVDNPDCKDSIMDIRTPVFDPQTCALKDLKPYLDSFPFPFYLILRDIAALPSVLSDALRQWFELAANVDKQ